MKADVKSSGFATVYSELPTAEHKLGEQRFHQMLERIRLINNETHDRFGDQFDGRDYKAIGNELVTEFAQNLLNQCGPRRDGFLRALSSFMSYTAEGGIPTAAWSPLHETAISVTAEGDAA